MADIKTDEESTQVLTPESAYPGGDLTAKTIEAIAEEVSYRRSHGLPIVVDRGNGVEVVQ
jgi:hypothetical protein